VNKCPKFLLIACPQHFNYSAVTLVGTDVARFTEVHVIRLLALM